MSKDDERIIVVPRASLVKGGKSLPQGFFTQAPGDWHAIFAQEWRVARRGDVEDDPSLKQIIPYVIVTRGEEVYLLRRLGTQDEARLRNLLSIGVGGHMREEPGDFASMIQANLQRELHEELVLDDDPSCAFLGYVNDDSNSVGSVHLGLVYQADATGIEVSVRETDLMEGRFVTKGELASLRDRMETWSGLITGSLFNADRRR